MAYLNSDNVVVFPCANRGGTYNLEARLTSEYYLTNIINQLIDKTSFVISPSISTTGLADGTPISFNINGYYFHISNYMNIVNLFSSAETPSTDIYASIRVYARTVTGYGANNRMLELVSYDSSSPAGDFPVDVTSGSTTTFNGVDFTTSEPEDESSEGDFRYSLHILHKEGANWFIPQDSTIKFVTNSDKACGRIDDAVLS